jgi:hypothetical protein
MFYLLRFLTEKKEKERANGTSYPVQASRFTGHRTAGRRGELDGQAARAAPPYTPPASQNMLEHDLGEKSIVLPVQVNQRFAPVAVTNDNVWYSPIT